MTHAEAIKAKAEGYTDVVYVHYGSETHGEPGAIVSKHKSYDAAAKAVAKDKTGHLATKSIDNIIEATRS